MSIRGVTFLLSAALAVYGPLAVSAQKPACSTGITETSSGPVCGRASSVTIEGPGTFTTSVYLGIPYAVPPTGPLRWQYPKLFPKSAAVLQATALGNECPQSTVGKVLEPGQSEDCLYLNVWVPEGAAAGSRLPVMVFIHGGSFVTGSGNQYDGTYLAASGKVIVVTINYRLGVLGFLAQGGNHNFGFADQILALDWVRSNIAGFGGNPDNVTLFGESAGAMSIGLHALSSPKSAGLFQAAIMESNLLGIPYKSTSQAEDLRRAFCSNPSLCTAAASAGDLVAAQNDFIQTKGKDFFILPDLLMWAPAVDGMYVAGQPMASAGNLGVPILLGTNRDEGTNFVYLAEARAPRGNDNPPGGDAYEKILTDLFGPTTAGTIVKMARYQCEAPDCSQPLANVLTDFAFTCANRWLAIRATEGARPQPVYLYQFSQLTSFNFWSPPLTSVPPCSQLVCHSAEIPYVFNAAGSLGQTFTKAEQALAQTIGGHWTSFATRHDPGDPWTLFKRDKTYRLLGGCTATANDPLDALANCSAFWDGIGYEKTNALTHFLAALGIGTDKSERGSSNPIGNRPAAGRNLERRRGSENARRGSLTKRVDAEKRSIP